MRDIASYGSIREMLEAEELNFLSPYASLSAKSLGRETPEENDDIRPAYQRDRDRIIHSKSFRRLKHKTQVFLSPEGDHYRTRLTHTLEVSQIARTIARSLRLNESLTEAIALGHDLGHTPFGHCGEHVLNRLCSEGFKHNEQSVRICRVLEKEGKGLNLTAEVLDGIRNHRTAGTPSTLEGQAVRLSDKIAYLNHDIDDAVSAGILKEEDIPAEFTDALGGSVHDRLNTVIRDVIINSVDKPAVSMSPDIEKAMAGLRSWMFENIYNSGRAGEEEGKVSRLIELLFEYYMDNTEELSAEYLNLMDKGDSKERVVCDYISGMTDNYAIEKFGELFVPAGWKR